MRRISFLSLVLALTMLLLTIPATASEPGWLVDKVKTYDGRFEDDDAWCADAMQTVYESGLMEGKTAARFDVTSSLTNAQITVITARLHNLLNGRDGVLPAAEDGQAWYQPAAEYLKEESDDETVLYLLKRLENETDYPNTPCTRHSFVWMLTAVLPESALAPINDVSIVPDTTADHVLEFYQAGILNGTDAYGTFGENSALTRGAAAAMLARIVDPEQRLTFTLQSFDLCRDVLGVEPNTVLLTVNGEEVAAELFAEQLCTSLYQWEGNAKNALKDAIQFWCYYQGPFRVMAKELGISIPAEKQAELQQHAQEKDGYLGLSAAYWQFRSEGSSLNEIMNDLYYEKDWKAGVGYYHSDLEKISESMNQNAVPAAALESMDLRTVYQRLMLSPYVQWRFNDLSKLP